MHRMSIAVLLAAALLLTAGLSRAAENVAGASGVSPGATKAIGNVPPAEAGAKAKSAKADPKAKLVDINSASKAELMKLPGIGDAEAAKIVAGRPYLSKTNLVTEDIIPQGVYTSIKSLIICKLSPEQIKNPVRKPH